MSHPSGREPDPSRTEAAEAGAFHERAEAAAGVGPREHVTADDLAPDQLAQQANADVDVDVPPQDTRRLLLVLVAVVAVAVTCGLVAVAVAIAGP